MIDSHCHLADKKFVPDLEEVLARAKEAGVERIVSIADSLEEGKRCIDIAEKFANVYATVGVHPHLAREWSFETARRVMVRSSERSVERLEPSGAPPQDDTTLIDRLRSLTLSSDRVVAIGEIGLDYHYMHSPKEVQKKVCKEQLALGKELGLPIVVHTREAIEDTWEIVNEVRPEKLVLHCCTEKYEDIVRFLERGYLVSFTGMITYPKAEEIRRTVKMCPLEQMMIETDAPYLAPQKFRGQRNEPAFVKEVARVIAQIRGISFEEVDRVTSGNACRLFGLSL